ncbi:MAG: rod shape-determining protein MreC [Actinobacteria bacterium RBG_19FT_COMBO_54_7]|uniref:Cell shape-determining protein MreC n=1 Tax=Candidatus Solincola sediminis TaxID=1797199 RepID=A0A1F2WPY4_9ACTN|nr:MAG: rod shape-determining protein MreC [Candidatus Solincola sediminis]OFW58924.1 MAG: rod shape-determining protein MreC [Candidatus Solincola sediminis]OFW70507.1 MAG: rod shape-determining protein MreC [Actinobacteria bacterium RBG_19FT_COMBO_54_7]
MVFVCILLVTAYSRESEGGIFHRLQRFSMDVVSPLQKGVSKALSPIKNAIGFVTDIGTARSERDRLREQVKKLQDEVDAGKDAIRELEQIKNMFKVKEERPEWDLMEVTVIGAPANVWEQTIQIDAGYDDGLQQYMAVLSEDGSLVGRVIVCASNSSVVQLMTDEKSSIGARLQTNSEMGIVKGAGNAIRMELLNQDAEVNTGDMVITSGMGGTCPENIPIGTITEISERRADLSIGIEIQPRAKLSRLEKVIIVLGPAPKTLPIAAGEGG